MAFLWFYDVCDGCDVFVSLALSRDWNGCILPSYRSHWLVLGRWLCMLEVATCIFLAASLLSRWPVYVRSGEWLYVRLSGVRRVCSGTEPQIWAPENDVFDARWTYRTYSTYTWDMWRLKPRSLDWF